MLKEEERRASCEVCSREFVRDRSHPKARTCSQPCSQQRFNRLRREKSAARQAPSQHCPECGGSFVPHRFSQNWQKFCSHRCSGRNNARINRRRNPGVDRDNQRKRRLDGNLLRALERDQHRCVRCGVQASGRRHLNVHHIDGHGGRADGANNDLENLATLCNKCHKEVHTFKYRIVDGEVLISGAVFDWLGLTRIRIVKEDGETVA